MPKNLVVCCDGTANEFKVDRTNVKLFYVLQKGTPGQACYYHPGVGTLAPPGHVTKLGANLATWAGLAFGYGLTNDLKDAYTFVANNYEPNDQLFLFGFSRGAYTVRALASMLHLYGLIESGNEPQVPYIIRMLWAIHALDRKTPSTDRDARLKAYFDLAKAFKATFASECKPHFVGVWDTVSSVGWFTSPLSLPFTANNGDIAIGRHALAIDERRAFFRPNSWHPKPSVGGCGPRDLKQVWFPGVHCDVGGGYPEGESGLSKFSLQWMLGEAESAGLVVDEGKRNDVLGRNGGGWAAPSADAILHESLIGAWKVAEYVPKPERDHSTGKTS
jgi:uncharacterized protein (DUF2235 family)